MLAQRARVIAVAATWHPVARPDGGRPVRKSTARWSTAIVLEQQLPFVAPVGEGVVRDSHD